MPPRTPADYPGRPGPKVVPNDTDQLDLELKADLHRRLEEAHDRPERTPWYRRRFHKRSS